jgi:sugar phosphate isomerase/epimerase
MRFNKIAAALVVGALSFVNTSAMADEATAHREAAIKHIKEALEAAKQNQKDQVVEHAKAAREETRAAMNQKTTASVEKASILVRNAIEAANDGHVDVAAQKLEEAEKTLSAPVGYIKDSQG